MSNRCDMDMAEEKGKRQVSVIDGGVLWVAEKQSVAKLMAEALGDAVEKERHYVSGDNLITWARGSYYDPGLPEAIPTAEQYIMVRDAQFFFSGAMMKRARQVNNCCDVDDIGDDLFNGLIKYFEYTGEVKRIKLIDMTRSGVLDAIQNSEADGKQ